MKTMRVLEVIREDGTKLWLFRRHGAVLRLSCNAVGQPYRVHIVATLETDRPVAQLLRRIPNNRRDPVGKRRKTSTKIVRNSRAKEGRCA